MLLDFIDYLKENKGLAALIIGGIVVLLALGIAALSRGCSADRGGAETAVPAVQELPADDGQGGAPETVEGVRLSSLQAALAENSPYGDALILGILQANTWVNTSETATVDFGEHVFTERVHARETATSFVAVDVFESTGVFYEDGVAVEEKTWLVDCVDAAGNFFFIEVYMADAGDGTEIIAKSSAFSQSAYVRVAPTDNVEVLDLGEDAASLIDGKTDELALFLCDWCSLNYPTVTKAAYAGTSTVDFGKGEVKMSFTLDNSSRTGIRVIYDTAAGSFDVGR